jgi:hypothetical protein
MAVCTDPIAYIDNTAHYREFRIVGMRLLFAHMEFLERVPEGQKT